MSERNMLRDIREALGLEPDLVLWRNSTGTTMEYRGGVPRGVAFGLGKGGADLVGILGPHGRFVGIEVKGECGRLSADQINWASIVRKLGGFAAVVRSVDEARAALERARKGEVQ